VSEFLIALPGLDDEIEPHPFTLAELERLAAYRGAIAVGFYSDELAGAEHNPQPPDQRSQ
jgi:hypothetical protein